MDTVPKIKNVKQLKWNFEACKEEALKYPSRNKLYKGNQSAYNAAKRYGWLGILFPKVEKPKKEKPEPVNWGKRFFEKVHEIHGDRFDTSQSVYVNNTTPVTAVCKYHGEFTALPHAFLDGIACPECIREASKERNLIDIETFKERYYARFGPGLIFDKAVYVNTKTPMLVTCPKHGDFWKVPNKLMSGFGCPKCAKEHVHDLKTLTQEEFLERIHNVFGDLYDTSLAVYVSAKTHVKMICKEHGVFEQTPEMLYNGFGCPHCANQTSNQERELIGLLKAHFGDDGVEIKNRDILDGKEIDIVIPSKKVGIEYNGNFWHCEGKGKDKNYHVNKTNLAESKGYRLIQIFDDEYFEHKDLVIDKLLQVLGCNNKPVIGARKCTIQEIHKDTAREFLDKYHMQGFSPSTLYYGAYYDDKLVGVMTFRKDKDTEWELNRFSTYIGYSIPGLANKMFKRFLDDNEVSQVKSFLDRRWGKQGNSVYEKMGFTVEKVEGPDYRYLVNRKRVHKFNFRKKTLNEKYGLPMTMTEREMAEQLGINRIWDCGLIKYVYKK